MKKIVTVALATSMVAASAFAETKISNNFRIRPVIAEWDTGTEAPTYSKYFELDKTQNAKDTLTFESKTDYAGVKFAFSNGVSDGGTSVGIDSYNGFIKFGGLTITGGYFDSRIANRVTNDQNNLSLLEQNWAAKYNTAVANGDKYKIKYASGYPSMTTVKGNKKLGVNANSGAAAGIDSDNITAVNGTKSTAFVLDYCFADVAGGKLQLWGALNRKLNEWQTTDDDGANTVDVDSSYAFRGAYTADAFAFDANLHIWRRTVVASAFFSPKMVDGLAATLGFTFANDGKTNAGKAKDDAEKWLAIDARARYAISDALAASLFINYTNHMKANDVDAEGILDTVLNVTYGLNDIVKVFAEGEVVFLTNSDTRKLNGTDLAAQLGALFTAGKGAEIDVAVRGVIGGVGHDNEKDLLGTSITVPVCMRIKL